MIGTVRWNVVIGLIAMAVTFLFSFGGNTLPTSLTRGAYAFVIFFLLAFVVRWALGTLGGLAEAGVGKEDEPGRTYDQVTPDEQDSLQQMLKQNLITPERPEQFAPLSPPKLQSKKQAGTEDLVQAIRHFNQEDGR